MPNSMPFHYPVSTVLQGTLNGIITFKPLQVGQPVSFMDKSWTVKESTQVKVVLLPKTGALYLERDSLIVNNQSTVTNVLRTYGFTTARSFTLHVFTNVPACEERPFRFVYFNHFYEHSMFHKLWIRISGNR